MILFTEDALQTIAWKLDLLAEFDQGIDKVADGLADFLQDYQDSVAILASYFQTGK